MKLFIGSYLVSVKKMTGNRVKLEPATFQESHYLLTTLYKRKNALTAATKKYILHQNLKTTFNVRIQMKR